MTFNKKAVTLFVITVHQHSGYLVNQSDCLSLPERFIIEKSNSATNQLALLPLLVGNHQFDPHCCNQSLPGVEDSIIGLPVFGWVGWPSHSHILSNAMLASGGAS